MSLVFSSKRELHTIKHLSGSMGHPGRFCPWTYEGQFDMFFTNCDLDWTQAALDKKLWKSLTMAWVKHKEGELFKTAVVRD